MATKRDLDLLRSDLVGLEQRLTSQLPRELNRQTWRLITGGIAIAAVLTANNLF